MAKIAWKKILLFDYQRKTHHALTFACGNILTLIVVKDSEETEGENSYPRTDFLSLSNIDNVSKVIRYGKLSYA